MEHVSNVCVNDQLEMLYRLVSTNTCTCQNKDTISCILTSLTLTLLFLRLQVNLLRRGVFFHPYNEESRINHNCKQ